MEDNKTQTPNLRDDILTNKTAAGSWFINTSFKLI